MVILIILRLFFIKIISLRVLLQGSNLPFFLFSLLKYIVYLSFFLFGLKQLLGIYLFAALLRHLPFSIALILIRLPRHYL